MEIVLFWDIQIPQEYGPEAKPKQEIKKEKSLKEKGDSPTSKPKINRTVEVFDYELKDIMKYENTVKERYPELTKHIEKNVDQELKPEK